MNGRIACFLIRSTIRNLIHVLWYMTTVSNFILQPLNFEFIYFWAAWMFAWKSSLVKWLCVFAFAISSYSNFSSDFMQRTLLLFSQNSYAWIVLYDFLSLYVCVCIFWCVKNWCCKSSVCVFMCSIITVTTEAPCDAGQRLS